MTTRDLLGIRNQSTGLVVRNDDPPMHIYCYLTLRFAELRIITNNANYCKQYAPVICSPSLCREGLGVGLEVGDKSRRGRGWVFWFAVFGTLKYRESMIVATW